MTSLIRLEYNSFKPNFVHCVQSYSVLEYNKKGVQPKGLQFTNLLNLTHCTKFKSSNDLEIDCV